MSPSALTNQCVAGALATCALLHVGDPRWNHAPPLFGNAIDLFGVARAQGFQVSGQPAPGEMVVYGSSYGVFGHIATVVAVEPGRYEVIEQNFLDFNPNLEPHWQTFDLRSIAWPDASVVGFGGGSEVVRGSYGGGPPSWPVAPSARTVNTMGALADAPLFDFRSVRCRPTRSAAHG